MSTAPPFGLPERARAGDRLQPALLDRISERGDTAQAESGNAGFMTRNELRQAILRDLGWLLNAVQPMSQVQAARHPRAADSVLNFGLPALAGEMASRVDVALLERAIFDAIVRYEPRILAPSLSVQALHSGATLDTHNVIEFEIRGQVWARPMPLDMLLRTRLDLEGGHVEVREVARSAMHGAALRAQADGRR